MNKELEALENIKHYDARVGLHEDDYKIIETALEELEVKREVIGDILSGDDDKKLKALEIIKDTLGIELRYCETTKTYHIEIGGLVAYTLKNKEEYELLKEVLL